MEGKWQRWWGIEACTENIARKKVNDHVSLKKEKATRDRL